LRANHSLPVYAALAVDHAQGVHVGLTPFTAYSSQSLLALLLQRLSKLPGDVFQPAALDFASRKVSLSSLSSTNTCVVPLNPSGPVH
jgi:hypothetical protein